MTLDTLNKKLYYPMIIINLLLLIILIGVHEFSWVNTIFGFGVFSILDATNKRVGDKGKDY